MPPLLDPDRLPGDGAAGLSLPDKIKTFVDEYWWAAAALVALLFVCCCCLLCIVAMGRRRAAREKSLVQNIEAGKKRDPRYGGGDIAGMMGGGDLSGKFDSAAGSSKDAGSSSGKGKAPPGLLKKQPSKLLLGMNTGKQPSVKNKADAQADEMRAEKTFMSAQI